MPFPAITANLHVWANHAVDLNLSYYRSRRDLWTDFVDLIRDANAGGLPTTVITNTQYLAIRSFLTNRNASITDDSRLAFDTTVLELLA